jgi:dTDP-4-amino-4,6-dideoxygalactose transaminase
MTIDAGCSVEPLSVIRALAERNIEARPIWKPMHMQPVFAHCDFISTAQMPVSEDIFARGLCLPSDIKMTEEELSYVIDTVKAAF